MNRSGIRPLSAHIVPMIFLSFTAALAACSAGTTPTEPKTQETVPSTGGSTSGGGTPGNAERWTAVITSEGGIAGRGNGGIVVSSDGKANASDFSRGCNGSLSAAELEKVQQAVSLARGAGWREGELPPGSADFFKYVMTLSKGSTEWRTSWHEDPASLTPDARQLYEALWSVRQRILSGAVCS